MEILFMCSQRDNIRDCYKQRKDKKIRQECLHFPGVIFLSLCGDSRDRDEAKRNRGAAWHFTKNVECFFAYNLLVIRMHMLCNNSVIMVA